VHKTVFGPGRLRSPLVAGLLMASVVVLGAAKRDPRILVYAPVPQQFQAQFSQTLWANDILAYLASDSRVVVELPTIESCRASGAFYMVAAPFDERPRLPGAATMATGRVMGQTHLVVTNCLSGDTVDDAVIAFESDPQSGANEGDFESTPEVTWAHTVQQLAAKHTLKFPSFPRVVSVRPPFVDIGIANSSLKPGDRLRVFATRGGQQRSAVIVTVTEIFADYVQATFAPADTQPNIGDYLEPIQ
jgi:hypothetical protein